MLTVLLEGLMEQADEEKRCGGAARGVLGELLEHENIGFLGAASSKLKEFTQLIEEDEDARVTGQGGGRIDLSQGSDDTGAIEEVVSLGQAQKMVEVSGRSKELTVFCPGKGMGDALEDAKRGGSAAGSDQDGEEAAARFVKRLQPEEAVRKGGVGGLELTASGSR
jgi:hypothetical protein